MINSAAFEIATNRHAHNHRRAPVAARTPTHQCQLVANLMHGGPDVIEELNLNHRFQSARRHANSAPDDVGFGEWRIKDTHTAKLSLQIRGDLKHAAFTFNFVQGFFARAFSDIFAKYTDARVARHFGVQAAIDQVNHGAGVAR